LGHAVPDNLFHGWGTIGFKGSLYGRW